QQRRRLDRASSRPPRPPRRSRRDRGRKRRHRAGETAAGSVPRSARPPGPATERGDRVRGLAERRHGREGGGPDLRRGPEPDHRNACTGRRGPRARIARGRSASRAARTLLTLIAEIRLAGAGGEPVDFVRTIVSHGVAELPPNRLDFEARALETTLPVASGARTVRLTSAHGKLRLDVVAGSAGTRASSALEKTIAHMFRLDEDLSAFYSTVREDAELAWCAQGAGRMLRAPTVYEDVVKTICTTNTSWSGTRKMTHALVDNLGVKAPGGGRTFPTAEAMADVDEGFYREVVRAGYRGPYF